jgi:hypothetical protein
MTLLVPTNGRIVQNPFHDGKELNIVHSMGPRVTFFVAVADLVSGSRRSEMQRQLERSRNKAMTR